MSTPTRRHRDTSAAPIGARDFGRVIWNQLTSMRTALLLLFALAVAAIPGSLIPQRPTSPVRVRDFTTDHPTLARIYRALGLFDVYASPWFAAIYLLLFLSLIGCIIPRLIELFRTLRKPPPRTPTNLSRLPAYVASALPADRSAAEALEAGAAWLRGQHYRVEERPAADGRPASVAAERGYLREAGNLVFHIALVFVLIGLGISALFGFKGNAVVVEGGGFSNALTQYDDFTAGAQFHESRLTPFTVALQRFDVSFETGAVQPGAARSFDAHVDVTHDGKTEQRDLLVNHPIDIGSTRVHLLQHGYAVNVTVKDAAGNTAYHGPVICLPQDGNFTSRCAIKAPDARPQRLAFDGMFLPTAVIDNRGPHSEFPDAYNPQLVLNAWTGAPRTETGTPESVYSIDHEGMTQVQRDGQPFRMLMRPDTTVDLPDGQGSITFHGYQRWIKLQVSQTPGVGLALASLAVALTGLCCSLYVRPRRLWLRVVDGPDGPRLEAAGLDKVDGRVGLEDSVAELAAAAAGTTHPAGDDDSAVTRTSATSATSATSRAGAGDRPGATVATPPASTTPDQ